MSVHFISGKPGGGKSLYAMKLILEELRFGLRRVVTNVAINLGRLNEYIQQTWPNETVDVLHRVKLLSDEECKKFWLHRAGPGESWNLPNGGAFIVLDELHLFFNAREWMHTGVDCLHYLSQHRKLGDDVICITQHVGNVDKQFRSVAQDFTLIVNGFKQKLGWFRGLPMFHRYTYAIEPNGSKTEPDDTGHFRLDAKGVASCYDTAAGIGVHGRGADKEERKKGLSPFMFPVIALVVILAIVFGIKGCNAGMKVAAEKRKQARETDAQKPPAPLAGAKQADSVAPAVAVDATAQTAPQQLNRLDAVGVVADRPKVAQKLIRGDGRVRIVLTDGRVFESSDGDLEVVQNHRVKVSGQWYGFKEAGPGARKLPPPVDMTVDTTPKPLTPLPESSSWQLDADGVAKLKDSPRSVSELFR